MRLLLQISIASLLLFVTHSKANDEVLVSSSNLQFDHDVNKTNEEQYRHRNLQLAPSQRWKARTYDVVTVPYTIASSFTTNENTIIKRSMTAVSEKSGVVRFVRRSTQPAYIAFRGDGKGCTGDVGQDRTGTIQVINLAKGCVNDRTIQRLLLRALGINYENSRPDRDKFITINLKNVPEKYQHNFDKAFDSVSLETPYDYGSVMHFGSSEFSIDSSVPVITTKNGSSIEQSVEASPTDLIKLRLLYQCLSGPRTFISYNSSLCTSDCKCWEGAIGCNFDNTACHGDLECVNNVCVKGNTTDGSGGCTDVPSGWVDADGDSCQNYTTNSGWCEEYGDEYANGGTTANQACCGCGGGTSNGPSFINLRNLEADNLCIDVKGSSTTDGTAVVHDECNGASNQKWYWDSNNYIRSALDINKCLVGARGLSDQGTDLIINTCFANDSRFQWGYYSDLSIRPFNNVNQCIVPSIDKNLDGVAVLHMLDCATSSTGNASLWRGYQPPLPRRSLQSAMCTDAPLGWYNMFGDNCAWYAEDKNYCKDYGYGLMNFGKTANQACCVCGGGSNIKTSDPPDNSPLDNPTNCWDTISGWVDSVGDGCDWYSQGDNCIYYGSQFANPAGSTAKKVCCACGGGSPQQPTTITKNLECSDNPSRWVDENNDGCSFYAIDDNCKKFGDIFSNYNKTANEVCCACKELLLPKPSPAPSSKPCGLFRLNLFCPFTFCGIFGRLFGLCKN